MAARTPRAPKLFPPRIAQARFQKAILRRIHTSGDRDYLLGLYRLQAGTREREGELGAEDVKRLAALAKSIARNRGVVQVPKLVILAVILTAILAFNLFFKNALLSRALEAGLQGVFGARAEVAGLDFRLLGGSLSFRRLAVADRDRPMRNLFELGYTQASLDVLRLLEARVHVRNLECRDLDWDTPREVSGALPGQGAGREEAGEGQRGGGLRKAASGLLEALDIPALLEEQEGRLSSAVRLREANARLEAAAQRGAAALEKSRSELQAVSAAVEELRGFDYGALSDPKQAQRLLALVRTASPAVKSLAAELSATGKQLGAEVQAARTEQARVRQAVAADLNAVKAGLSLSGGWKSLASGLGERLLARYLGRYAGWALKAKDAALALRRGRREEQGARKPASRGLSRQGRRIAFPGAARPRFLLSQAAFSSAPRSALPGLEASVRNITSDPDILGQPLTFQAAARASEGQGGRALSLQGAIDPRGQEQADVQLGLQAENWQVELREELESLSLASLSAQADLAVDMRLPGGGGSEGAGSLRLRSLAPRPLAGEPLGEAVGRALASAGAATMDFSFGPGGLSVRTNLDEVLAGAARGEAARLAAQYEGRLREELEKRLEPELQRNEALLAGLSRLQQEAGEEQATAGSYAKVIAEAQRKAAAGLPKLGF